MAGSWERRRADCPALPCCPPAQRPPGAGRPRRLIGRPACDVTGPVPAAGVPGAVLQPAARAGPALLRQRGLGGPLRLDPGGGRPADGRPPRECRLSRYIDTSSYSVKFDTGIGRRGQRTRVLETICGVLVVNCVSARPARKGRTVIVFK